MKDYLKRIGGKSAQAYKNLSIFEAAGIITSEYVLVKNRKTRTLHFETKTRQAQTLIKIAKLLEEYGSDKITRKHSMISKETYCLNS
jgi:hypothetical protein